MRPGDEVNLSKLFGQRIGMDLASAPPEYPGDTTSKTGAETWQDPIQTRIVPEASSIGVAAGTRTLRDIYRDAYNPSIGLAKSMHSIISHRVLRFIKVDDVGPSHSDSETSGDKDFNEDNFDTEKKAVSPPRNFEQIISSGDRCAYLERPCPTNSDRSVIRSDRDVRMSCLPSLQPQYLTAV